MNVILTHQMKVLYIKENKIIQKKITDVTNNENLALLERISDKFYIKNYQKENSFDINNEIMFRSVPSGILEKIHCRENLFHLKNNDKYLRADNNESIDFTENSPLLWETFKEISIDLFIFIKFLLKNNWNINGENMNFSTIEADFDHLRIGGIDIRIDELFSKHNRKNKYPKELIFNKDWKVFRAILINPVLLFVVFGGGDVLKQFSVSIKSLFLLANYDGIIIIITDNDNVINYIPEIKKERFIFIKKTAYDRLDFVGARLSIFNSELLEPYQPIIYSDSDVVFDKDINDFIIESAYSKKCSAQTEIFNYFKESSHVGAHMYMQDPYNIDNVNGFNGGIFMVPNIDFHGEIFKRCYYSMQIYSSMYGRDSIPFYDQSIMNYVLYKMGDFDPSPVTERTQVGGDGLAVVRKLYELNPNQPKGFVHFWNAYDRHVVMDKYLNDVIEKMEY